MNVERGKSSGSAEVEIVRCANNVCKERAVARGWQLNACSEPHEAFVQLEEGEEPASKECAEVAGAERQEIEAAKARRRFRR